MKFVTPTELKSWIDDGEVLAIIDTREADKFELGHIPGAVSMPQIELPYMLKNIDPAKKTVIYCIYGMKSEQVYIYLKDKLKIKELYILEGGLYQYATDIDPKIVV